MVDTIQAAMSGLSAFLHWRVLLTLGLYAVCYYAVIIGLAFLVEKVGVLGTFMGMFVPPLALAVLEPIFIGAIAGIVVGLGDTVSVGYILEHAGSLMAGGLFAILFVPLFTLLPVVGSLTRDGEIAGALMAIPIAVAVAAPGLGFGRLAGIVWWLFWHHWFFLIVLALGTKLFGVVVAVVTGLVGEVLARRGTLSDAEDFSKPLMAVLAPIVSAFPVFALLNLLAQYATQQ